MSIVPCVYLKQASVVILLLALTACAETTPRPVTTAEAPGDIGLAEAAGQVAADLAKQIGPGRDRAIAIDPLLDRTTGQQTAASVRAQGELETALATAMKGATIEPLQKITPESQGLVATGSVGSVTPPDRYVLTVALTDRASGLVVAQSAARFREGELDTTPTPFYANSPSLVRDRSVDGYLKTTETPKGSLADPLYVEQLPTAALIAAALDEYNAGRWESALAGYTAAAARADGQTLRTFNGIYLTNMHLRRTNEAEAAFGKIVALGLNTNNLAVKLLFRPGTTDFLADPNFSEAYPMWLRQIARGANSTRVCLSIVGHTSASGTPAINDPLSLARAEVVRTRLLREAAGLEGRLKVNGVGSRKNIVGTGADDASDAVDRRVEFEVQSCSQ
jgi:outer membrane protein OmpA-like peptidoglycan-associated protein